MPEQDIFYIRISHLNPVHCTIYNLLELCINAGCWWCVGSILRILNFRRYWSCDDVSKSALSVPSSGSNKLENKYDGNLWTIIQHFWGEQFSPELHYSWVDKVLSSYITQCSPNYFNKTILHFPFALLISIYTLFKTIFPHNSNGNPMLFIAAQEINIIDYH